MCLLKELPLYRSMVSNQVQNAQNRGSRYLSGSPKRAYRSFSTGSYFSRKLDKQRALRAEEEPDADGTTNQLDRYRENLRAPVTRDDPQHPIPKINSNRTSSKETSLRNCYKQNTPLTTKSHLLFASSHRHPGTQERLPNARAPEAHKQGLRVRK